METYFMFGKYPTDSLNKISPGRTHKAMNAIQKIGGRIKSVYALLGEDDLVFIVNLKDAAQATLASIALSKATGISFRTSPAIPVEKFDQLFTQGHPERRQKKRR